ncbi:MAG: alginate lyase family protein [Bacteroidota bacterium]
MKKFLTYLRTIQYLKPIQIYYQIKYRARRKMGYKSTIPKRVTSGTHFTWKNYSHTVKSMNSHNSFTFINKTKVFSAGNLDWNYSGYGKLWTYNLNYFDFLNQKEISKKSGLELINDYIRNAPQLKDGNEPYPTSLRIINWVKFVCLHTISNESIDDFIHEDGYRLSDNIEYHLLANHLLENGFAFLFSGVYLKDSYLFEKGKKIVLDQLCEQLLPDGAHFELSPMYHQLMLFRVLDSIQLLRSSGLPFNTGDLIKFLEGQAGKMHCWMNKICFENGEIPLINDAAKGINPSTKDLNYYFDQMELEAINLPLQACGYRKFDNTKYEALIDVGSVSPGYQPGHSHADTFSYLVNVENEPFISEAGTATYTGDARRAYERSTQAHNTVSVNGNNSSEVWDSFRVGKRAVVMNIEETEHSIEAKHNGFGRVTHGRKWEMGTDRMVISDTLTSGKYKASSYIHFHPNVKILDCSKNKVLTDRGAINVSGHDLLEIESYGYAEEFNTIMDAKMIRIDFSDSIITTIDFN